MSHDPKSAILALTLGGALLSGCESRDDGTAPGDGADAPGRLTFASTGDRPTFASGGDRPTFSSGGTATFGSARPAAGGSGASAAPSVDAPAVPAPGAGTDLTGPPDAAGPDALGGPEDSGDVADAPGTIGGGARGVTFSDDPYTGFWEGPDPDGFDYRWVRRIAIEPPYLMVRTYIDEIDGATGEPANCFGEFGNRHIVEDIGGNTLRGVTDDDATENYREYELRDGRIVYSKYGDGGELERRETWTPALEGLAAVDLPVCRPTDAADAG